MKIDILQTDKICVRVTMDMSKKWNICEKYRKKCKIDTMYVWKNKTKCTDINVSRWTRIF